jgi:hypothetical protein
MFHHTTQDKPLFSLRLSHINIFINFIASTKNTVTKITLLLTVNSFYFCIILFAFTTPINQMTQCHIPEELNLQQHYVKIYITAQKYTCISNRTFQEGQNYT